jgi:predicted outer membrane lipoprotein
VSFRLLLAASFNVFQAYGAYPGLLLCSEFQAAAFGILCNTFQAYGAYPGLLTFL